MLKLVERNKIVKTSYMKPNQKHTILLLICLGVGSGAVRWQPLLAAENVPPQVTEYVVKKGDVISKILFEMGIGTPASSERIYGKTGWLERLNALNPNIKLSRIYPGQKILLPRALSNAKTASTVEEKCASCGSTPTQDPASTPVDYAEHQEDEKEETRSNDDIVNQADQASVEEIVALPPEMRQKISADTIAAKLDKETVDEMDDETVEKVPAGAVHTRAKQLAIGDGQSPEMNKLFKNLKRTATAYVGARAGFSFGSNDSLATKIRTYGLFAEIREGTFEGFRFRYDNSPKYKVRFRKKQTEALKYERLHLGWAFELPGSDDIAFHVTPRAGFHRLNATLNDPASQGQSTLTLQTAKSSTLGFEADAELARYFYLFRFWVGRDFPLSRGGVELSTTRLGIDAYIKDQSVSFFGTSFVPSYLVFASYEKVEANDKDNRTQLDLPFASLGFGLMLHID